MKLKKILIVLLVVLIVFLIYLTTLDKKVYYLAVGDYLTTGVNNEYAWSKDLVQELKNRHKLEIYVHEFSDMNMRTTDFLYQINNNEKRTIDGKEKSIKNALIKADLVTLSIGMNDFLYKMNMDIDDISMEELYDYVDEMMVDLDETLKLVREYCKEDILITNYYVPQSIDSDKANKMIYYANKKLNEVTHVYDIKVIDLSTFSKNETFFHRDTAYLSKDGNKELSKLTEEVMINTLFN